jgi:hypothetical protein
MCELAELVLELRRAEFASGCARSKALSFFVKSLRLQIGTWTELASRNTLKDTYIFIMNTRIPLQPPKIGSLRSLNAPPRRFFGMRNDTEEDDDPSGLERSTRRASAGPNHRRHSFISRWRTSTDVESAIKSPPLERPPIPNALRGSESDSTPLPALSMIVLSIVSVCVHLHDMANQVPRLCLESFFPPTSPCRFSFSWSKVRDHMWHSCCLTNELGFRIWRDQ